PDDAYQSWKDFRRNVIDIAVDEINTYADLAGFTVDYEGLREGKGFGKIKFTVTKTDGRHERETLLGRKAKIHKRRARAIAGLADPDNPPMPSGDALDPYEVIGRFQDKWRAEGCAVIRSPDGAFLKFAEGMFKARAVKGRAAA